MKVVIDTNVIVSALINRAGIPAKVLTLAFGGKLIPLFDNRTLAEYVNVLSRKEFCFDDVIVNHFIEYVKNAGEYVTAEFSGIKFTDDTDKKFYELYISGGAQYLITGNKKHFPSEKGIVTPSEFLKREYEVTD